MIKIKYCRLLWISNIIRGIITSNFISWCSNSIENSKYVHDNCDTPNKKSCNLNCAGMQRKY
uniref:VE17 n=1 Tax=Enterococcus faecalis TaxID=1351 RepID=C4P4J4_ENTFL|nr:VE17 [Enterococcus faecalis]